jgi:hypothetical protein
MREGAGKTGCFPHPRSRVPFAQWQELHTSIQVQAEHPGLPCAMALRLTSRSSRRTALLPPSPALPNASLAPAPRRPNHATSPYAPGACVSRAWSVHRIPPRVRDVRTPLSSGETGGEKPLICPTTKAEYFRRGHWTGFADLPVVLFAASGATRFDLRGRQISRQRKRVLQAPP